MIVDIHTHAFPDTLAERAVPALEQEGNVKACLDGKVASLIESMDSAGIDASVVASIATKPGQFDSIFRWSESIATERIIPFPSVHPKDPDAFHRIGDIKIAGFRGIKLHPYYQEFTVDALDMLPIYEKLQHAGLVLLLHTGFDIAYERYRIADPVRIASISRQFPELKLITSHFGAWEDWDEVERYLLGKSVFFDTSYSIPFMGPDRARDFLLRHHPGRILFGSDSPWGDQAADLAAIRRMGLDGELTDGLLGENARLLLGLG